MRWTATKYDQLEAAIRRGARVALTRRGTEYIVVARRLATAGSREEFIGVVPMTGEELSFRLDDIDSLEIVDPTDQ